MARGLLIAFIVFVADQLSKWLVLEYVFKAEMGGAPYNIIEWYKYNLVIPYISMDILPFFNLTMVWNDGIGFGLFGAAAPLVLVAISLIICAILLWYMRKLGDDKLSIIACGLMIGGALGNILDRLRFGAVADFLDFHIGNWHYPVFNIADCAVVIGVVLLLIWPLIKGKLSKS